MIGRLVDFLCERFVSYPTIRTLELGQHTAVFETTNSTEDYRARELGGERKYLTEFVEYVDSSTRVWDVGANIGVFSIFAARAGGEVYAFEPHPGFANRLRRNRYLNGQQELVTVREYALSDEEGEATLFADGIDGPSPGLSEGGSDRRERVQVEQKRGDLLQIAPPELIKIDVEGAEADVIRGLTGILEEIETVVVEVHPSMLPRFDSSAEDVHSLLDSHGFSAVFDRSRNEQQQLIYRRSTEADR